ncbi:MAG: IS630 family transposase [Candidatus Riflebacteria bacterium]|nr:IS630 family transposase [Candidatus Riflebacteria bacterium]
MWFQDEARFGQQGNLYRIWTKRGLRHRTIKQQGFKFAYLLGAVNPQTGEHVGLIFEDLDSTVVNIHLKLISDEIPKDTHVVLVCDQAGYHKSRELEIPENITMFLLEPYSPELNPVERIWRWIKTTFLGNRIFKDIADIFQAGITAWSELTDTLLKSICRTRWLGRTN